MLPEIHRLPLSEHQTTVVHAQRQGLTGESSADMGRHVVIAFIVVEVTAALAIAIAWTFAVIGNNRLHPGVEVFENPRIGVFVDGEAGARVQTGEMQHPQLNVSAADPAVELFVQAREALAWSGDHQLIQNLVHGHVVGSLSLVLWPA